MGVSSTIFEKSEKVGWRAAIKYAEDELEKVMKRETQLRSSISTFKAKLKAGVAWPGTEEGRDASSS
jgi:hypothetical protein